MPRSPNAVAPSGLHEALLAEVLRFDLPTDQVLSSFFRAHPKLGARDRAMLADAIWSRLRQEPVPAWLGEAWSQSIGSEEAQACAQAMAVAAPMDLRVNTLLCKPSEAIAALAHDGIAAVQSAILESALRVQGRPSLHKSAAFLKGWVEVQDLGSQILARLVAAKRGQFIVDFCAGAGGKTLAIGADLKNTGRLYALDISAARLAKFKPRLARSGLSNVWPTAISGFSDDRVKRLAGKADAVLVDAPCSGLGTLRRNPDLKWRMSLERIAGLAEQQEKILSAASRLLKPSGRLVYATCSPLPQENNLVVDKFLQEHSGFYRVPVASVLQPLRLDLPQDWKAFTAQGDLMLWPHRTGTDGFYAAVLERGSHPA